MDQRQALLVQLDAEFAETARATGRAQMSARVRAALAKVRREAFVPDDLAGEAYANIPLPIGEGQTISQPFIVALMTEALDLAPTDIVLEIGTGSGYQAAVLAELAKEVWTVEVIPALAERAREALAREGYRNVQVRCADGGEGWPEHAPYDAIIVTAAAPEIPPALAAQLKPGGRIIIPVGQWFSDQQLVLAVKDRAGHIARRELLSVAFVPFTHGARRQDGASPAAKPD
jgi:protein-L-isoaspartate(D-aspartate) O-methyltransferase